MSAPPALECTGCGAVVAGAPLPFRCPADGDGRDHVLARPTPLAGPAPVAGLELDPAEPNPFVRYRRWSYAWQVAQARGLSDAAYVELVRALDRAVAAVDGHGFAITPYRAAPALAASLGWPATQLWVKDETGNVAGSHKARHLFGLAVYLAVAERTGLTGAAEAARPLAIASCGNAALAAAVVARAAGRRLLVFVPPSAEAPVVARLRALGAELEVCPRRASDPPGDPCHHRFRAAVAAGALPFSCQGSDNGLTIDGGMTLGFELAEQSVATGASGAISGPLGGSLGGPISGSLGGPIDRLLIQVGGGALASAVIQGLQWRHAAGALAHLPAIHAVQTEGCFPLVRAWRRVARALITELGGALRPGADLATDAAATCADAAVARWLLAHADASACARAVAAAATDRAHTMWPWESEPHSAASGILDDETYDWLAIVRGMLATGGWPVVAAEPTVLAAHRDGRAAGVPVSAPVSSSVSASVSSSVSASVSAPVSSSVSATGAAGLAGVLTLAQAGLLDGRDRVAVLFTGVER